MDFWHGVLGKAVSMHAEVQGVRKRALRFSSTWSDLWQEMF